jgi:quercetin dioxygenase-like cupin family protein
VDKVMKEYPQVIRKKANKVAPSFVYAENCDGYVHDGVEGSQTVYWTYRGHAIESTHSHEYDEYLLVVEGSYYVLSQGKVTKVKAGEEYLISKGVDHGGEANPGRG